MQAEKVGKNCKSVILENGYELTYCEFGEEHEEVIITAAMYFFTFLPIMEKLAAHYHVYGIVMRDGGEADLKAEDGEYDWPAQWGKDVYDFARAMSIDRFVFMGKCHGSVPGWDLLAKHPEMLTAFIPLELVPVDRDAAGPTEERKRLLKLQLSDTRAFIAEMVRKPENIEIKLAEARSAKIGDVMKSKHRMPLDYMKTTLELTEFFQSVHTPVLLMFATADEGFQAGLPVILNMLKNVQGMKAIFYQGEKHFFEMDIPEKLADDIHCYLTALKRGDC